MDDDGMIWRGLGVRANQRTATNAALVRLDGIGEAGQRGRTWQCGRCRSRIEPGGRCQGRMRRWRGRRGRTWLCGGGWGRGATLGDAGDAEASRGGAGARGDTWGAEAVRGCAEGSGTGGVARVGAVDGPAGKGGTTVGDTGSRSRDTSRLVREVVEEDEEKGKSDSSKTT
jgi:hypothetical protein